MLGRTHGTAEHSLVVSLAFLDGSMWCFGVNPNNYVIHAPLRLVFSWASYINLVQRHNVSHKVRHAHGAVFGVHFCGQL